VDRRGQVLGVLHLQDALRYERGESPPLGELIRPVLRLRPETRLPEALRTLQTERKDIAVVGVRGKPQGLITVKDLVEPLTGELSSW
jgi:CBS domain containing-hemolysin-like protein